ncbi:hypothetical protein C8R43DRAFT_943797 [Mycena crocata]|nr:hypothetical protein C8R43DRAFT_943797 [Mycena crocata]
MAGWALVKTRVDHGEECIKRDRIPVTKPIQKGGEIRTGVGGGAVYGHPLQQGGLVFHFIREAAFNNVETSETGKSSQNTNEFLRRSITVIHQNQFGQLAACWVFLAKFLVDAASGRYMSLDKVGFAPMGWRWRWSMMLNAGCLEHEGRSHSERGKKYRQVPVASVPKGDRQQGQGWNLQCSLPNRRSVDSSSVHNAGIRAVGGGIAPQDGYPNGECHGGLRSPVVDKIKISQINSGGSRRTGDNTA